MILSIFSFISWYLGNSAYLDVRCGGIAFLKNSNHFVVFEVLSLWVSLNTLVVES